MSRRASIRDPRIPPPQSITKHNGSSRGRDWKKADETPYTPDPEDLTGDLATILVGASKTQFDIPIKLLSKHSPFFEKAFCPNSLFLEANTQVLELPDDLPPAFACVVRWMFERNCGLTADSTWLQLSQLWILVDKLLMALLCNEIISLFPAKFQKVGGCISPSTIMYVFENTVPRLKHPLRRMIVDVYAWGGSLVDLSKSMDVYDKDFLNEIWHVLKDLEERDVCTELSTTGQPFAGNKIKNYFVGVGKD